MGNKSIQLFWKKNSMVVLFQETRMLIRQHDKFYFGISYINGFMKKLCCN